MQPRAWPMAGDEVQRTLLGSREAPGRSNPIDSRAILLQVYFSGDPNPRKEQFIVDDDTMMDEERSWLCRSKAAGACRRAGTGRFSRHGAAPIGSDGVMASRAAQSLTETYHGGRAQTVSPKSTVDSRQFARRQCSRMMIQTLLPFTTVF